jgi:putative aldouronate transport system substrate-binding protein
VEFPLAGQVTDRRNFLRLSALGALAVGGSSLLAGCGGSVSSSGGSAIATDKLSRLVPNYTELAAALPQPDIAGTPPFASAYSGYPASVIDVITEKPGKGGAPISAMYPGWGASSPPAGQNAFLDAVNTELGTPVHFSVQDGITYSDKLNAIFGARDVPEVLAIPNWELQDIPRFSDAAQALFEDLTPYLAGSAVDPYPMLANLPTSAWRQSIWADKLFAIPNAAPGSTPGMFFYRKDVLDGLGLTYPKTIEELREIGRKVTDPAKGVWAFNMIHQTIQQYFKVPFARDGWGLDAAGKPVNSIETPQYRDALAFTRSLFAEGLIHPDVVTNDETADAKGLFKSGRILFLQDGPGAWQNMQAEQQKVDPHFRMLPVPLFSAVGGDPLAWFRQLPTSYAFVRKGLPADRIKEILSVANWCSAPFGTAEYQLREYGVEGMHYTKTANGPVKTELAYKEGTPGGYFWIGGRPPVQQPTPATPDFPRLFTDYNNSIAGFREKDPWEGLQLEWPARFASAREVTEDKMGDILRGRRPLGDLDAVITEWRTGGGDEARGLLAKALESAGR